MHDIKNQAYLLYVEKGYTAKDVANAPGLSPATICRWNKQGNWK